MGPHFVVKILLMKSNCEFEDSADPRGSRPSHNDQVHNASGLLLTRNCLIGSADSSFCFIKSNYSFSQLPINFFQAFGRSYNKINFRLI